MTPTPTPAAPATATPVVWWLRAWMIVEIFFGLAAISAIFLRPDHTATNFAWPIKSTVMAAVLGAFYFASALLFVLPLFEKRWQNVRVMILPTAIFAAMMCLTTFLHWSKFSLGTLPFGVWLASYVLPPPIFVAAYLWHQRRAEPVGRAIEAPLPTAARSFLHFNGMAVVLAALALYAVPALLLTRGPWPLTPLTVRALCSWLIGVGLLQHWMAWENDWRRVRLATAMLLLLPPALFVQLARFRDEVAWSNPALWLLLVDVTTAGLLAVWLWRAMATRATEESTHG
ncbi:MAG: hypothetical protein ABI780_01930 [Ardenticatenales bacterium]